MCEIRVSGNVTGPITDRDATKVKGIRPNADAIIVIISGLDRVLEYKRSIIVCRRRSTIVV